MAQSGLNFGPAIRSNSASTTTVKASNGLTDYNKMVRTLLAINSLDDVWARDLDAVWRGRPTPRPNFTTDGFLRTRFTQAMTSYNAESLGRAYVMTGLHRFLASERSKDQGNELPREAQPHMQTPIVVNRDFFFVLEGKGLFNSSLFPYYRTFLLGSRLTGRTGEFRWTVWRQAGKYWNLDKASNSWISNVYLGNAIDKDEDGVLPMPWYFYAVPMALNVEYNMAQFRANGNKEGNEWVQDFYVPAEHMADFEWGVRLQLGQRCGFTADEFKAFYLLNGITPRRPFGDEEEMDSE